MRIDVNTFSGPKEVLFIIYSITIFVTFVVTWMVAMKYANTVGKKVWDRWVVIARGQKKILDIRAQRIATMEEELKLHRELRTLRKRNREDIGNIFGGLDQGN